MENYTICNCKNVTYFDVAEALHNSPTFSDVEKTFEEVQKITHCSTGCGGCHGKILDAISEIIQKRVIFFFLVIYQLFFYNYLLYYY